MATRNFRPPLHIVRDYAKRDAELTYETYSRLESKRNRRAMTILWLLILMALVALFTSGCTTEPRREFSSPKPQDVRCLLSYGGAFGYCDKR